MITLLTPDQDQALRRAVLRDDNFLRFVPPPPAPPVGEIKDTLRRFFRPTPAQEDEPPAAAIRRRPPRYLTADRDYFAAVGAFTSQFSNFVRQPVVIERIVVSMANADASNSHIAIFIRRGEDQTAGLTDDDLQLYTNVSPSIGTAGLFAQGTSGGYFEFPLSLPYIDVPFSFHIRANNGGAVNPLHGTILAYMRVIEPEELPGIHPPALSAVHLIERLAAHNPTRLRGVRPAAGPPAPRGMQVCALGFCRPIPWQNLAPELKREWTTNEFGGVPTPGMSPVY